MVHPIDTSDLKNYYRMMYLIRNTELEISKKYSESKMRCPTHLSVGQEAISAALSLFLSVDDFAISTHRGHAHYISKGGDLNKMIAELYGKQTGCCKGRGGSMHLADKSVNFMGTSAIVGNSIPIGTGLGLAAKLEGQGAISVVYLGDAAVEEGVFYESVNFAIVSKLPVLYVCENNGYSVYSDFTPRQPSNRKISDLVSAIGMPSTNLELTGDADSLQVVGNCVEKVRDEIRPHFIEVKSTRFLEHCGPNDDSNLGYRSIAELDFAKAGDPLEKLREKLVQDNLLDILNIEFECDQLIVSAFEFAETSPYPNLETLNGWVI